jgi:hypothetical protein
MRWVKKVSSQQVVLNNLVPLSEIFEISYGVNLELNKLEQVFKHSEDTVNFVSRTAKNNGISAIVKKIDGVLPQESGTITVAGGGSVLETFLQPQPYYSGRDLFVLTPKAKMTEKELLFYVTCIRINKYKYSYGRQANKTLKDLLVPDHIYEWAKNMNIPNFSGLKDPVSETKVNFDTTTWSYFNFVDIFDIKKGKRQTRTQIKESLSDENVSLIPFVAAKADNNAVRELCGFEPLCTELAITVNYNGSVGEAFFQDKPFYASDDIIILTPKKNKAGANLYSFTPEIAMFFTTVIRAEKYRFNYGRKWNLKRFKTDKIKLPKKEDGTPDFLWMSNYIKSLSYSSALENFSKNTETV